MRLHDESLDSRIQNALDQLKLFPPRDGRAAARGRVAFLAEAELLRPTVPAHSFWRHISWDNLFPRKEQFRMAPIVALILSLTLAGGGSGVAVYASQDALPNDPLYAVKILSEDARVNLTSDGEACANLMLDLAARRVSEIAVTNGTHADVLARQQAHIASALQIAAGLSDTQMNQVLARTRDVLDQGLQMMDTTPGLADARTVLAAEREFAQAGLDDQAAFRKRFHDSPAKTAPFPPDFPAPPFTSTLPITGTWPAPPPPDHRGTPPFTSTLPITRTWPAPPPPDHRGTPPFTSTLPITGTWQTPPRPTEWHTPMATPPPKSTPASGPTPQSKSTPVAPPPQPPSQPPVQPQPPRGTGK